MPGTKTGLFTYPGVPPDSSVIQFGEGSRWELAKPTAGNIYKWIYTSGGVWLAAGSM